MPDPTQVDRLLEAGRKREGLTTFVHRAPPCYACQQEGKQVPAVVDGVIAGAGSILWSNMCRAHYAERGIGLGEGRGQVLIPTAPVVGVDVPHGASPVGYALLINEFSLAVLPPPRVSFVGTANVRREILGEAQTQVILPPGYATGSSWVSQLEFALKHEGVNLEVLAAFFRRVDLEEFEAQLTAELRTHPLGQYLRRLWFLYEWLTERTLPVPDLTRGNYVPLLDPEDYYTGPVRRIRRQRIDENLLGERSFSPMVRRTKALTDFEKRDLRSRIRSVVGRYDVDTLRRAVSYLYLKETRSSFAIEGERPSANKEERFAALLHRVPKLQALNKEEFIGLQNVTVDERFANQDYRQEQVYVAMELYSGRQRIEYIAPKPEDVPGLMEGLLRSLERLNSSDVDPVIEAAAISFGFVFIHPFSDGNGRLHRMLIHYILSRRGVTPTDFIFPVSAIMASKRSEYDGCLESFSRPLMQLLDYTEDDRGEVTVHGDSVPLYRYLDATRMAEDLYRWVFETVDTELQHELDFIVRFRAARRAMEEVVDMPDKDANLFVRLCRQNGGHLSKTKRESLFSKLTDSEVQALEALVREHLLPPEQPSGTEKRPFSDAEEPTREQSHPAKHTFSSRQS
jgi:hypothetical protein